MWRLAETLGDRWAGGIVVSTGERLECFDPAVKIWAVPAHRLPT